MGGYLPRSGLIELAKFCVTSIRVMYEQSCLLANAEIHIILSENSHPEFWFFPPREKSCFLPTSLLYVAYLRSDFPLSSPDKFNRLLLQLWYSGYKTVHESTKKKLRILFQSNWSWVREGTNCRL